MINEKNKFLTVSWLSGLLSAEIFISTGEWGVQMPPLTTENSHFLRSGSQEAALVMGEVCEPVTGEVYEVSGPVSEVYGPGSELCVPCGPGGEVFEVDGQDGPPTWW